MCGLFLTKRVQSMRERVLLRIDVGFWCVFEDVSLRFNGLSNVYQYTFSMRFNCNVSMCIGGYYNDHAGNS